MRNSEILVKPQLKGENGSTEAKSNGTKRATSEKNEKVLAKIQRLELNTNVTE